MAFDLLESLSEFAAIEIRLIFYGRQPLDPFYTSHLESYIYQVLKSTPGAGEVQTKLSYALCLFYKYFSAKRNDFQIGLQPSFLIAYILANKHIDDFAPSTKFWTQFTYLSLRELLWLELTWLRVINWALISAGEFSLWAGYLDYWIARRFGHYPPFWYTQAVQHWIIPKLVTDKLQILEWSQITLTNRL